MCVVYFTETYVRLSPSPGLVRWLSVSSPTPVLVWGCRPLPPWSCEGKGPRLPTLVCLSPTTTISAWPLSSSCSCWTLSSTSLSGGECVCVCVCCTVCFCVRRLFQCSYSMRCTVCMYNFVHAIPKMPTTTPSFLPFLTPLLSSSPLPFPLLLSPPLPSPPGTKSLCSQGSTVFPSLSTSSVCLPSGWGGPSGARRKQWWMER